MTIPVDGHEAVCLHGSGGLNRWCSPKELRALEQPVVHYRGPVINGTMTVDQDADYVDEVLRPVLERATMREIVIYVRERTNLGVLAGRLPSGIELHLDHGAALRFTRDEAVEGGPIRSRYALFALREDDETSPDADLHRSGGVRMDLAIYARSIDHWGRIHALARSIVANRTHSAISGAVVGKPTTLLGCSYDKLATGLRETEAGIPRCDPIADLPLVGRAERGRKVRKTTNRPRVVSASARPGARADSAECRGRQR